MIVIPPSGGAASQTSMVAVALGAGALDVGALVTLLEGSGVTLFEGTGVMELMDAEGKGGRKVFDAGALGAILCTGAALDCMGSGSEELPAGALLEPKGAEVFPALLIADEEPSGLPLLVAGAMLLAADATPLADDALEPVPVGPVSSCPPVSPAQAVTPRVSPVTSVPSKLGVGRSRLRAEGVAANARQCPRFCPRFCPSFCPRFGATRLVWVFSDGHEVLRSALARMRNSLPRQLLTNLGVTAFVAVLSARFAACVLNSNAQGTPATHGSPRRVVNK